MRQGPEHLTSPVLASHPRVHHGFFTRRGGVSAGVYAALNCGLKGDDPAAVRANRARVAATLGVDPAYLLIARQVHGVQVATVTGPWAEDAAPEADGLVTATPGLALSVVTADCVPVLFSDAARGVIGAAHAGWRGALAGIADAVVEAMERQGAQRKTIAAALGPCIGPDSYEVGEEFQAAFLAADAGNDRFFAQGRRPGHAFFDLPGYLATRLRGLGLLQVDTSCAQDTAADAGTFFSNRRSFLLAEKGFGVQISTIALTGR